MNRYVSDLNAQARIRSCSEALSTTDLFINQQPGVGIISCHAWAAVRCDRPPLSRVTERGLSS